MTEDFQKTVNLREKMKKKSQPESKPPIVHRKVKRRAEEIDQVYNSEVEDKITKPDLRKITRPEVRRVNEPIFKRIIIIVAFIVIGLAVYGLFFRGDSNGPATDTVAQPKWYAVKLVTGEVYYGQISDIAADPIIISSVYYNYDQLSPSTSPEQENEKKKETGSLRLVKRGKETHGPEGTMNIVRSQVIYMEPLKEDSKVLKAILDYER